MAARKSGIKGNSGKAKRYRQLRKLGTVVGICLTIIMIYEWTGVPKEKRRKKEAMKAHASQHKNIQSRGNPVSHQQRR